jgi:ornithine carrier protein
MSSSPVTQNQSGFGLVQKGSGKDIESMGNSKPNESTVVKKNASLDTATTALKDIAFGSFAGVIGKVIEYPFDTVKVRLQAQPDVGALRYTGPLDCFKQALKSDGFRGLYRGLSVPLVGAAAETSSLFFSVGSITNSIHESS